MLDGSCSGDIRTLFQHFCPCSLHGWAATAQVVESHGWLLELAAYFASRAPKKPCWYIFWSDFAGVAYCTVLHNTSFSQQISAWIFNHQMAAHINYTPKHTLFIHSFQLFSKVLYCFNQGYTSPWSLWSKHAWMSDTNTDKIYLPWKTKLYIPWQGCAIGKSSKWIQKLAYTMPLFWAVAVRK